MEADLSKRLGARAASACVLGALERECGEDVKFVEVETTRCGVARRLDRVNGPGGLVPGFADDASAEAVEVGGLRCEGVQAVVGDGLAVDVGVQCIHDFRLRSPVSRAAARVAGDPDLGGPAERR